MFNTLKDLSRKILCQTKMGLWLAVVTGVLIAISVSFNANAEAFSGMKVQVEGSGPALIFIPGLNSASGTFTDTCAALKQNYTCHLLHLPGFAGQPADSQSQQAFLTTQRDNIVNYIEQKQINNPILVGHSLGGVLSLMIAIEHPELAQQLVIVDALPFHPAIQNPTLTAATMEPQAEQMRTMMNSQSDEDFFRNAQTHLNNMINQPASMAPLSEWSKSSDRTTTTRAMYDMMTTDLRPQLDAVKTPTLVLGAWAGYQGFGATQESTKAIFTSQFAALKDVDIRMSDAGFHFLTWDDHQWVVAQIKSFISTNTAAKQ